MTPSRSETMLSARRNQEDGIKEADHGLCVAYKRENRRGIKSTKQRKKSHGETLAEQYERKIERKEREREREREKRFAVVKHFLYMAIQV